MAQQPTKAVRRLNKKLVIWLTVGGMVVMAGVAVVLLRAALPDRDPAPAVAQAEEAAAKQDYATAAKYYQRAYARAKSGNRNADESNGYLIKMGDMLLASGDAVGAWSAWKTVTTNDPENEPAQQKVVDFLLQAVQDRRANWTQVQEEAAKLNTINPQNGISLHALGMALINQRDVKAENAAEGEKKLIEAVQAEPGNGKFSEALAVYYFQQQQVDKAVETFDQLMAHLPEDQAQRTEAWRRRGRFYLMKAVTEQQQLASKERDRSPAAELAGLREKIAQSDAEASRCLQQALELAPQDPENLMSMAEYWTMKIASAPNTEQRAAEQKNYLAKAEDYYKQAIAGDPDGYEAYLRYARLHMDSRWRDLDKAYKTLQARHERGFKRDGYMATQNKIRMAAVRNEMVRISMLQAEQARPGDTGPTREEIIGRLEQLHREQMADFGEGDASALFIQGRIFVLQNEPYKAIKSIEQAEKLVPDVVPELKQYLAQLYMQVNEYGPALDALRHVVRIYPDSAAAWATMATLQVQLGNTEEGLQASERALSLDPDNTAALLAAARVYEGQKNWAKLEEIQRRLATRVDVKADKLQRAAIARLQAGTGEDADPGLAAESEKLLREVLREDPLNETALRQLTALLVTNPSRTSELRQILEDAKQTATSKLAEVTATQPSGPQKDRYVQLVSNIERMQVLVDPNATEEEKFARFEEIISRGTDPFVTAVELARLYATREGKEKEVLEALQTAHKLKPEDAAVFESLFSQALRQKEWALADQLAQEAVTLGIARAGGHFHRGRVLGAQSDKPGNLEAAVREFREGLAQYPTYSLGQVWLGRALTESKQYDDAERAFAEALRLNPNNRTAALALASLASMRGNEEDKAKYLEICRRLAPDHPWVREQLQAEEDRSNPAEGIARREAIRKSNPKDITNLVLLAALYLRQGQNEPAEAIYQEALQLDPENMAVLQAYVAFLRKKTPPDPELATQLIRQAIDHIDINKDPSPERKLKKATAQLVLANHFAELVELRLPGAPTDIKTLDETYTTAVQWCDQAVVMADVGVYFLNDNRFAEGDEWFRKSLAKALAENPAPNEDERRARKLILEGLITERNPAKEPVLKKELDEYRTRFPDDATLLLAESDYHAMAGRLGPAMELISQFIRRQPDVAVAYAKRGDINYRRSLWQDALEDYRQAKSLDPATFTFDARVRLARCQENLGRDDLAISELSAGEVQIERLPALVQELVRLHVKQKNWKAAEELINTHGKQQPDNPFWPALLSRMYMQSEQPEAMINAGMEAIRRSKFSESSIDSLLQSCLQLKRYDDVMRIVNEEIPAEHRDGFVVQLRLASATAGRGLPGPATDLYNRLLDRCASHTESYFSVVQDVSRNLGKDAATKLLNQRLAQNPEERGAKFALSSLNHEADNSQALLTTAQALLAKLPESDAENQERLFLLRAIAVSQYQRKEYDAAKSTYEQMLKLNPNDVVALNNLAYLLLEQLKDPQGALVYSQKAAQANPLEPNILDTLGWNLVLLERYEDGIAVLRRGIALQEQSPALHYHVAEGFYRHGEQNQASKEDDHKEAITELRRAHELIQQRGTDDTDIIAPMMELAAKLGLSLPQPTLSQGNVSPTG